MYNSNSEGIHQDSFATHSSLIDVAEVMHLQTIPQGTLPTCLPFPAFGHSALRRGIRVEQGSTQYGSYGDHDNICVGDTPGQGNEVNVFHLLAVARTSRT